MQQTTAFRPMVGLRSIPERPSFSGDDAANLHARYRETVAAVFARTGSEDISLARFYAQEDRVLARLLRQLDDINAEVLAGSRGLILQHIRPFRRFRGFTDNVDELEQAAVLATLQAFQSWSPHRKGAASWSHWVSKSVPHAIRRTVHSAEFCEISYNEWCLQPKVRKAQARLLAKAASSGSPTRVDDPARIADEIVEMEIEARRGPSAGPLTTEAIAEWLSRGISAPTLTAIARILLGPPTPVGFSGEGGGGTTGVTTATPEEKPAALAGFAAEQVMQAVADAVGPTGLMILLARMPLDGSPPATLVALADETGIGREVIRRKEVHARQVMATALAKAGYHA